MEHAIEEPGTLPSPPQQEISSPESTPTRVRSLVDLYETCNLAILEPENYDVASKQEWVYKTKLNPDGSIQKHKARLVAKGYSQQPGVDYNETFAPVARLDTIRALIALSAQKGWSIYQLDVKSAFLNGILEEEIYVEQPQGFVVKGNEDKVLRLRKALYGLKQAPRAWYSRIDQYFMDRGFRRSKSEPTLYIKTQGQYDTLIVSLYVDDLIYTGNNITLINGFKEDMMKTFEMTDLGLMNYFLGIEMQKDDGSPEADASRYRSLIGSLLYLTATRPDIMYATSLLSRFMQKPSQIHFGAGKRILRYLQGTKEYGMWYKSIGNSKLLGYTDSDWAGSLDDMKSTSGYAFSLGSGFFSWASKKQATVAQSTAEAEYVAAAEATSQSIWLRRILGDMGEQVDEPTIIYCDNKSAIAMANNPVHHHRTKHIAIKYHFIREANTTKQIQLEYCTTEEQIADIFTKALPRAR
ncbi:putative LRR receptor-like protein kinase, partial [Trifolium pratense]